MNEIDTILYLDAPQDRAKSTTEHHQNSNGNQNKHLPSQVRGQLGMSDAKNSFEKQLELQQKKLLEMQQKTVEDFHKALSNSNELLEANSKNTGPPHVDSNDLDESIAKDSLEVDSNDSSDERQPVSSNSNKRDISSERPKNPEPFDLDSETKENGVNKNNENNELDSKPQTSYGSRVVSAQAKFRTPHSTATVSAQEARSLRESTDNVEKVSVGPVNAKTKETPEPHLEQGSNEDVKNNSVQKPTTNIIKRKPLPVNQANTVSKNVDKVKPMGSNGLTSSPMTNSNSSIGSQSSNAKAVKQEPGPTTAINSSTNINNNGIPAKTPLQYIAYTPIRKWDSPGTTSPKPVAEVAPVLTTAPDSHENANPNPDKNGSGKLSSDKQNTTFVHSVSSKSDVMDEAQLKYSAKTYMSSITHPNTTQPVVTVRNVIDPLFSIYNNQLSSKEQEPVVDRGEQSEEQNWSVDVEQEESAPQEVPKTFSGSSVESQKSMIAVQVAQEINKSSVLEKSNVDNFSSQQTKGQNDIRRAYSAEERRSSDGSIGSQRSRPEIRSSSPFDRLVDGSNADDIEELQAPEELPPRPKSILKRVSSLENCNQFNIKDSLDLGNVKKVSRNATPVIEKPSSAKRSVRFAETIQVQSKAEIDERLPISQARAVSAREKSGDTSDKSASRKPPRNVPLKPTTSQTVPSEIEQIRATQQTSSAKDADFSMTKTPTDDEINALWESIRETMPDKNRRGNSNPDSSSNKSSLYVSNGGSNAYYSNYIKNSTQTNPPTIASQYIDGSNLFLGSSPYPTVSSQTSVARPVSATTVPRKQHLLGHRHQQSVSKAVSPHVATKNAAYQNGAMITGSFPNQQNGAPTGNHVPVSQIKF